MKVSIFMYKKSTTYGTKQRCSSIFHILFCPQHRIDYALLFLIFCLVPLADAFHLSNARLGIYAYAKAAILNRPEGATEVEIERTHPARLATTRLGIHQVCNNLLRLLSCGGEAIQASSSALASISRLASSSSGLAHIL